MTTGAASWVWANSRAANGSLIVLLAIADEIDKYGNCVMSHSDLVQKTRLSDRAMRNGVADLIRLGELKVLSGGVGRGNRTAYAMTGNLAESATFEPGKGAESATFGPETWQNLPPSNLAESATFEPPHSVTSQVRPVKGAESATFGISDVFIGTTGSSVVDVKDVPAKLARGDVDRLCAHLADRIEANGCKRPAITAKWRDACRLMLDKDGRTEQQVRAAIDWCQDSEFWRSNILSMPKLREKYEQLRMQAMRNQNGSGRKTTTTADRVQQAIEAGKRVQAMLNGAGS